MLNNDAINHQRNRIGLFWLKVVYTYHGILDKQPGVALLFV